MTHKFISKILLITLFFFFELGKINYASPDEKNLANNENNMPSFTKTSPVRYDSNKDYFYEVTYTPISHTLSIKNNKPESNKFNKLSSEISLSHSPFIQEKTSSNISDYQNNNSSTLLVNENENGVIYAFRALDDENPEHSSSSYFIANKARLLQQIKKIVDAKPNKVEQALYLLNQQPENIKQHLQSIFPRLLQPENLVRYDLKDSFLTKLSPQHDHLFLAPLNILIEDLKNTAKSFDDPINRILKSLIDHYEDYLNNLLNVEDRAAFLTPKVILINEGFDQSEEIYSYRISQEMSYQLLSRDLYGISRKYNAQDSHAGYEEDQVLFKVNSTLRDSFRYEAASYTLGQILFKSALFAPTTSLLLYNVHIKMPIEGSQAAEDFNIACKAQHTVDKFFVDHPQHQQAFKQSTSFHIIQASQKIEGIPLEKYFTQDLQGQVFSHVSFSQHIILSLLLDPNNSILGNFIVNNDQKIIGIEDNVAFRPNVDQLESDEYSPVKNILYCLPLMEQSLAKDVVKRLISDDCNSEQFNRQWLENLKNQRSYCKRLQFYYEQLREVKLINNDPLTPWLSKQAFKKKYKSLLNLWNGWPLRLQNIQQLLQENPDITHNELLNKLQPHYSKNISKSSQLTSNINLEKRQSDQSLASFSSTLDNNTQDKDISKSSQSTSSSNLEKRQSNQSLASFSSTLDNNTQDKDISKSSQLTSNINLEKRQSNQSLGSLDNALVSQDLQGVISFIERGEKDCKPVHASVFYVTTLQNSKNQDLPLKDAFQKLMQLNPEVEWQICWDEILPFSEQAEKKLKKKNNDLIALEFNSRTIPPTIREQLFDKNKWKPMDQTHKHLSYAAKKGAIQKHGLYFKVWPTLPGLEQAVGHFTRQLLGFGTPMVELAVVEEEPVLISQGIEGDSLLKALNDSKKLEKLDAEDTIGLILAAMLINPEDGKPDGYIVVQHPTKNNFYRLISVDNGRAFVPPIVNNKHKKTMVKTILYCLDYMQQPVPPTLKSRIINIDPYVFIENWLIYLNRISVRYKTLFKHSNFEPYKAFEHHECFIGMPFQNDIIRHIYKKFVMLRNLLVDMDNSTITSLDLLRKLEPDLAKRYEIVFEKPMSALERFKVVDQSLYEKRKDGSHATRTKLSDILESMDIPPKKDILKSIYDCEKFCPKTALEELKQIKQNNFVA